jgi:hypothetical protein
LVNREAWGWRGTFAISWEEVKAALGRKTVKKEDATAKHPTQKIIQSSTLIRFHLNQGSSGVVIYRIAIIVFFKELLILLLLLSLLILQFQLMYSDVVLSLKVLFSVSFAD